MNNKTLIILLLLLSSFSSLAYSEEDKIKKALNVVQSLCLSGTEYSIEADISGNIVLRKLKGGTQVSINVRESGGATALKNELRLIGDKDVRECTQRHIPSILSAVLNTNQVFDASASLGTNSSIKNAKLIGYLPTEFFGYAEGKDSRYYRFQINEPSTFNVQVDKNSSNLSVRIISKSNKTIARDGDFYATEKIEKIFLVPGEYYIEVAMMHKDQASAYHLKLSQK